MKIIIVSKQHGQSRSITLGGWTRALLSVCLLGMPAALGVLGYSWLVERDSGERVNTESLLAWESELAVQKQQVAKTRQETKAQLAALTLKVGELQGRLGRLDALGERLTQAAHLDQGEFDFSSSPAVGGPETSALGEAYSPPDFLAVVDQLTHQIDDRQQQLEVLEALLTKRKIEDDTFVAGRPVAKGWMSSRFGRRTDPFTGKVAFHGGVDFSAKAGTEIVAVAAGVVTRAGKYRDYGYMVEINHGGSYATRYAHNKSNLVKVGDVVKKGQIIGLVGSTGRSTGAHVHFEVYKNGRAIDPSTYIHRASR
jgi:murein DD-endopeptidase MepM/ murein hydrolase activator NlpD